MKVFAIGDVHGHAKELQDLLLQLVEKCGYLPECDHLVLLGDLVDAGPDTKEVLDWCITYKQQYPDTFHPLKGNHDDMMVDALAHNSKQYGDYYLWYNQGGKETVRSYLPDGTELEKATMQPLDYIPKEHLEFLEQLPLYWETDEYFFVHAGVHPGIPLDIQKKDPMSSEVFLWIRSQFYNSREDFGKKIVFGHTSFEDHTNMDPEVVRYAPYIENNMIGINTMPRNFGHLTAVQLPDEIYITL